jgi:galactoside O-acetyltransferase
MKNLYFNEKDLKHCGNNVIIGKAVRIRKPECVSIGDNVIIDDFTYISCSLEIGNYTHISANTNIIGGAGKVTIGSFVDFAPGCKIVAGSSNYYGGGLANPCIPLEYAGEAIYEPIIISDFVLLGCDTVVLPGTFLPEGMATGAFTLVSKRDYEPWSLYLGVPCKFHAKREGGEMKAAAEKLLRERNHKKILPSA